MRNLLIALVIALLAGAAAAAVSSGGGATAIRTVVRVTLPSCESTCRVKLPDGTLTAEPGADKLHVTDGTGDYAGARGTATPRSDGQVALDLLVP